MSRGRSEQASEAFGGPGEAPQSDGDTPNPAGLLEAKLIHQRARRPFPHDRSTSMAILCVWSERKREGGKKGKKKKKCA